MSLLQLYFRYADVLQLSLLASVMMGLLFMIISSRNLISPHQQRRILKYKLAYFEVTKKKNKRTFSLKHSVARLLQAAGLNDQANTFYSILKGFMVFSFIASFLSGVLLGFSLFGSFFFALFSTLLSPVMPFGVLAYLRTTRNAILADELNIVMRHIVDAVESAGRTLQGAIEDSMHAAPVLAPHLQQFLNTYLTSDVQEAADHFREAVQIEEVELFLDLLVHGFEHATQELTRYFAAEADSYHELEISARQRRMDRREVFFDILMAFPAILGFALLIYPVFAKGVEAISHVL